MAIKLVFIAVVLLAQAGIATGSCDECDDFELCVQTECQCRPSFFRIEEDMTCSRTMSYTTITDFADGFEWNKDLATEGSVEYNALSQQTCEDFDSTLQVELGDNYFGCELIAFTESIDGTDYGVVVLSLFAADEDGINASEVEAILAGGLNQTTYKNDTIQTTETDECALHIDDCDVLASCKDTGASGFECTCSDTTDDVSPEGLEGRECQVRSFAYIVGIAAGASLALFIMLAFIIACVSTHTTIGKPASQLEAERQEKSNKRTRDTDETPLDPRGGGGGGGGGEGEAAAATAEGVSNGGLVEVEGPETIFDVNDYQMARLAQIHLAIERNSRPASAVPIVHSDNQIQMSALPSVDYGPEQRSAALYQSAIRQKQQNERVPLERLPSGEYLTPRSPGEMLPPSRQNPYGIRSKPRPKSAAAYVDGEMNEPIYSSRLPSYSYDPRRSLASPPPTPNAEPQLSRQSSSVFLPSSPRDSRDYGRGNNYRGYRY